MPYENEHSARLKDPDDFDPDSFRRKADGTIYGHIKVPETIDVIWGKLKGANKPSDYPIPQALRFPTKDWTVAEAKKWLKDNDIKYISFEAAESESKNRNLGKLIERRYLPTKEIRMINEENQPTKIMGLACVYGILSDDLGGWKELIEPYALKNVLANNPDVRALVDHISYKILGRTTNGTLNIYENSKGLNVEIIPPDTTTGKDIVISLERGDISGMSIQFVVGEGNFEWIKIDEWDVRKVNSFNELIDVSVVTFPAFSATSVGIRSNQEIYDEYRNKLNQDKLLAEKLLKEKAKRDRDLDLI
ncbi:MAG TPA: HK97 family phage prohead protease [Methanosarcinales archaeon]|nr:HK97 family phage prohead protease [Methanosarcinales archaeon]